MRLTWCIPFLIVFVAHTSYATVSVLSKIGETLSAKTLAQCATDASMVGKTIVVRSPQTVSTVIAWPSDRELRVEKGGTITFTGSGSLSGYTQTYGAGVPITWTFNASTGTDCVVSFGDGVISSTCGWTTTQGATGQKLTMLEGLGSGTNFRKISVPDTLTADLELRLPNTLPAGNQALIFTTPTGGVSTGTWQTTSTNPMTNVGDIIYGGTAGVPTRLADTTAGRPLLSGGVDTAPLWGSYGIGTLASLTAGTMTDTKYCTYSASGTQIICDSEGGASATWPATAGIPNYSGASSWETSYTTSGSGTELALTDSPIFTGSITTPSITTNAVDGDHYLEVTNTSAPTYASPVKGQMAYNQATDKLVIHNGSDWTTWNLVKNTDAVSLLGDATGTSLAVTGDIDGLANVVNTYATTNAVESPEKLFIYTFNVYATNSTAVTYTLPVSALGKQRCYRNYVGRTGSIRINTSASGQYIDVNGVNTASGGYVTSGGALGDGICFVGMDAWQWASYPTSGTWAIH